MLVTHIAKEKKNLLFINIFIHNSLKASERSNILRTTNFFKLFSLYIITKLAGKTPHELYDIRKTNLKQKML